MKANNDVTDTLQRTIGLMQGELERSVLSTQLLGGPQIPLTRDHSSPGIQNPLPPRSSPHPPRTTSSTRL